MPLAAGQSDKLGNRYEGVWTVDNLLDVLTGEALSLTVEPVGKDSHGIEFIKIRADGCQEFHSAKRQTTGNLWSLYDLTEGDPHDSVLGPLWEKLKHHPNARVVFVSGTTANEFNELAEEAARSKDLKHFLEVLDEAQWRKKKFDEYLLPLCGGSMELAFECLKRTEVVGITERHLIHRVEQRIQADLRSSDGTAMDLQTVRLLLADFVLDRFGQALGREELLTYLADHGCRERDLARDKNILALIADRNATYVRHVEAELIQNAQIERAEAKQACTALLGDDPKHLVVVVGAAGLGKSCVVAQTVRLLQLSAAPVVALRLDVQTKALTSDALGRELGLPVSPAVVLARIASGRRCVLVLDQMDALSFVSGRNQNLWDAFGELLQEAESVPNMRVLLACRAFDAEHDPRLRRIVADDKGTFRINLGLLEVDTVKEATTGATGSSPLNDRQIELLRIPLHLSLYLQGDPKPNSAFQTVQDLFGRYWTRKRTLADQQLGGAAKWNEVINALADWLSDHQTLSAPLDILDSWEKDARVMASQCVIVIDGMTCRFFHEAFFDYAFARTFAARGGKLCELLLASNQEQHLFRRAQVRQVLAYQRGRPGNDYASELRAVLSHPSVRFHLKKLGLDWLRSLEDPTEPEWQLLQEFDSDPKLGKFVRLVPSNSPAWFRVLDQTGTWAAWLDSGHESLVNHAIWLLSLPNVMKAESDKVAALIASRLDGSDQWRVRFTNLVSFADVHYSRKLFDLFLQAFRAGWFDAAHDNWWYRFHDMPKQNPAFACEFAAAFVERWLRAALEDGSFGLIDRRGGLPPQFMQQLEAAAPEGLARNLLPLVVATVRQTEIIHDDGEVDDRLCAFSFLHDEYDFKDALFGALQRSLAKLAVENPEILDEITRPYESLPHRTVAVLLLNSWTANGSRFADKVAAFILQNPHRLSLGYSSWSGRGGDGRYAITRAAFRAIGLHCSDENYRQLEAAVLAFWPAVQKQPHKGFNCYAQLLLLESLPKQRMSEPALGRLSHLLDKLPRVNFGPPLRTEVGSVSSPIPAKATRKMSDDAWILAMHKYSAVRPRTPENWLKGDMHTLSSELVREAQANKPRFAALALRMPGDLPRCYFDAILDGVAETYGKQTDDRKEDAVAAGPLDTHTIVAVIRRLHDLPGTPCGRSICSAFSHLADRQWPDDALDILSHYALNDPDPEKEVWQVPALGGGALLRRKPRIGGTQFGSWRRCICNCSAPI